MTYTWLFIELAGSSGTPIGGKLKHSRETDAGFSCCRSPKLFGHTAVAKILRTVSIKACLDLTIKTKLHLGNQSEFVELWIDHSSSVVVFVIESPDSRMIAMILI